jgi:4-amino-4-deoxy-L-arabinose transferase-like glycosyltransferase
MPAHLPSDPRADPSGAPDPQPGPRRGRLLHRLSLAAAVTASALPMLALSPFERLGYDAYWHVFIAGQEQWRVLWEEVHRNAHPPLFYLALKAAIEAFGASPIVYRLVPMLATVGSAWLVGRIVERITRRLWLPAIAAFAFGASLSAVTIGLDVRAYSLAAMFVLAACLALLDLVDHGFAAPGHCARVTFALGAGLALLTHYVTALFLVGCVAAALAPAAVDGEYRRRLLAEGRRRWAANLLTFAVPFAVLAVEYAVHLGSWGQLHHVPAFLFDTEREGPLAFVWRNTRALFDLFVPALDHRPFASTLTFPGPRLSGAAVGVLAAAALAAVAWLGLRPSGRHRAGSAARRVPPLLLLAMTGLLIALALLGRYPYGGYLRHQFVLFPFAVIVTALVADEVARGAARRFGRSLGALAVGLFALAVALNTASWTGQFRTVRAPLMQDQIDRFRGVFPAAEVIYVDQFNLVNLFLHHDELRWRFVRRIPSGAPVDLWRVGGDGTGGVSVGFDLCRDQAQWQLDLSQRPTYRRIRRCLDATGAERVTVFRPQQRGKPLRWRLARTEELARRLAESTGMVLETLEVGEDGDVYAAFARR